MSQLVIKPESLLQEATIELPLSKSIANRMLIIAYTAGMEDRVAIPDCDDSLSMLRLLKRLRDGKDSNYNVGDAGTVFRFLAALFAITPGTRVLGGSPALNNRPCGPLIRALSSLGAKCLFLEKNDFPPVQITGAMLPGGDVEIDASVSSQFISALMMVAPLMSEGLNIRMTGDPVSQPYIHLTARIMNECGIKPVFNNSVITIPNGTYSIDNEIAEGDWSAASYWFSLVALYGNNAGKLTITLKGLKQNSYQGDRVIPDIFEQTGVASKWENGSLVLTNTGKHNDYFSCNLKDYPDITPAIAVTCAGLQIDAVLTGLETLVIKESNRLVSLQTELNKLGYKCIVESNNTLILRKGRTPVISRTIHTYNDHRIAMAISLLSVKEGNLTINEPGVVNKSYPSFWNDLKSVGFSIE